MGPGQKLKNNSSTLKYMYDPWRQETTTCMQSKTGGVAHGRGRAGRAGQFKVQSDISGPSSPGWPCGCACASTCTGP